MARPKIYVCRPLPEKALALLRGRTEMRLWEQNEVPPPREVLLREVADIDGLLSLLTDRVDGELLDRAPRLRVVSNYAVGFDNIDVPAATQRGVAATHTPRVPTPTRGFNMRILSQDVIRREDLEGELGIEYRPFEEVLREADFVSVHVPLMPETRHLIGREQLKMMKRPAVLVNPARGPIVDPLALAEALREGWIWAAGLDVFEKEPIEPDHPLLALDNVIVVPHTARASTPP